MQFTSSCFSSTVSDTSKSSVEIYKRIYERQNEWVGLAVCGMMRFEEILWPVLTYSP